MVTEPTKAPGQGERIALSGLVPQTHYQIELILERLLEDDLEWFELASLEAGIADDLVLGLRGHRIWAYQFKHRLEGSLTFARLVDPEGSEPRLLRELADSWLTLRRHYGDHEVRVTLLTNAPLSSSRFGANIEGDHLISDPTLRAFVDEVWEPYRASLLRGAAHGAVPNEWQVRFHVWREATGLDNAQFLDFARAFSICSEREPHPEHRLADDEDVNLLFRWLQRRVAEGAAGGKPIRISSEEVKECLGAERFSYRNRHVFPIDSLYEPIEATGRKLESAIASIESGYIVVIGSPGSGKSSLLEARLRRARRPERIVSYYAYVPDDPYPAYPRLDSANFLHDLTKTIDDAAGAKPSVLPPRSDLSALRKRLGEQLLLLGDEFRSTGRKTIIIIDGLDHAQRPGASDVDRTFVSVLPEPHQVPDGVLVVVGTQHLQLDLPRE